MRKNSKHGVVIYLRLCALSQSSSIDEEINTVISLDLGLTKLVHLSDGSQIDNPRFATSKKTRRTLKIRQRRVSRKKKGSTISIQFIRVI
jgi:transposase